MNRRHLPLVLTAITVPLTLLLVACGEKPMPVAKPARAVYVTTVRQSLASDRRLLTATVRARVETELAFRAPGKLSQRLVDVGEQVRAGQVLARLDAADYELGVAAAAAQVQAATAEAEQAAADAARFQRLAADGSIGSADHERQQARADAAAARLDQARRQLALARNRSGYTTLVAPFAGVVTALRVETGQVLGEGQPVLSLARQDEREFVVDLPEGLVADIRSRKATALPGQGAAAPIALQLRELAPTAGTPGRTFRARFAPSSGGRAQANRLALGSTALVSLETAGAPGVLLPASAVVRSNGAAGVWAVEAPAGGLKFQPIQIAASEADFVRVTGLPDGLRVVTVGAQKLEPSMPVRPLERRDDRLPAAVARAGS